MLSPKPKNIRVNINKFKDIKVILSFLSLNQGQQNTCNLRLQSPGLTLLRKTTLYLWKPYRIFSGFLRHLFEPLNSENCIAQC